MSILTPESRRRIRKVEQLIKTNFDYYRDAQLHKKTGRCLPLYRAGVERDQTEASTDNLLSGVEAE